MAAAEGRLNVYPDPLATAFRKKAAALFGVDPEWVFPANGSDECLTLITRAFVDPGELVTYPYPSYILYETLADLAGGPARTATVESDWSWNHEAVGPQIARSKLIFVPNPNSPSGNAWSTAEISSGSFRRPACSSSTAPTPILPISRTSPTFSAERTASG